MTDTPHSMPHTITTDAGVASIPHSGCFPVAHPPGQADRGPGVQTPSSSAGLSANLLTGLGGQHASPGGQEAAREMQFENRLAMVRLGMATSLFYALRSKHATSAAHSLRVALACSAWAQQLGLADAQRDRIEVAALLHDIGKIGIPDRILRKPGKLTVDEQLAVEPCPQMGANILSGCTNDAELLDIVRYGNVWYNSRRGDASLRGDALPLGARMLAIADAFDAMTTEHVYRPARSRERAIHELQSYSGTQFDPELTIDFTRLVEGQPELLSGSVVNRWLQQLQPEQCDQLWSTRNPELPAVNGLDSASSHEALSGDQLFVQQLSSDLQEGVVFTDNECVVTHWNEAMERITGVGAEAMIGKQWSEQVLRIRDTDDGNSLTESVVLTCIKQGVEQDRTFALDRGPDDILPLAIHVSPVFEHSPRSAKGTVLVVRDLSDKAIMERRLKQMHEKATLDPLTRVANRAAFDSRLEELTRQTNEGGPTFSLMICDIDFFKRVNDVHGHPAGDEALVSFASILAGQSRGDDLVARYGGEEFVVLSANCVNATATKRAEAIRKALETTPLPSLGGESVTASFGVTEYQAGDTAETILARSDRALLKAKDNGRNRVIQMGVGKAEDETVAASSAGWFGWLGSRSKSQTTELDIYTTVPMDLTIEKLRGFIADHHATVINVQDNQLSLSVSTTNFSGGRRAVDSKVAFNVSMVLSDAAPSDSGGRGNKAIGTKVHVSLKPARSRDRRTDVQACANQVIVSLNGYLVGQVVRSGD